MNKHGDPCLFGVKMRFLVQVGRGTRIWNCWFYGIPPSCRFISGRYGYSKPCPNINETMFAFPS